MAYTDIDDSTKYFNTLLYSGNNSAARAVTGVGFQPDWLWIKDRTVGYPHITWDSARTNKNSLAINTDAAEVATTGGNTNRTLTSFDSDGFTTPNATGDIFNDNGTAFVAWNWKTGTAFSNDASSTSIGDIDSAGSVSTDAGISILTYTGNGTNDRKVAHGLGAVPVAWIIKRRNAAANWTVQHIGQRNIGQTPDDYDINLNTNDARGGNLNTGTGVPTSQYFFIGNDATTGADGGNYVAFVFAEKQGFSKFANYKGNGNDNGKFVYTGFAPAWVMVKKTTGSEHWNIYDNKRGPSKALSANLVNAERALDDSPAMELLSNGFKIRTSDNNLNDSGENFVFFAFAAEPLVTSTGIPATAKAR